MDTATQQDKLLTFMKNHPEGVNSFFATYGMSIKQASTRIKELRQRGYNILSVTQKDRSVNWVLVPAEMKQIAKMKPAAHFVFDNSTNSGRMVSDEEWRQMQQPVQQNLL